VTEEKVVDTSVGTDHSKEGKVFTKNVRFDWVEKEFLLVFGEVSKSGKTWVGDFH